MMEYTYGYNGLPWVKPHGDTLAVDLCYPRNNTIQHIEVGLLDVRAADSIRIHYDFDRDGWSIEQASVFSWDENDSDRNHDWQEVAFVKAWARDKEQHHGAV